jgi:hypothetical protein
LATVEASQHLDLITMGRALISIECLIKSEVSSFIEDVAQLMKDNSLSKGIGSPVPTACLRPACLICEERKELLGDHELPDFRTQERWLRVAENLPLSSCMTRTREERVHVDFHLAKHDMDFTSYSRFHFDGHPTLNIFEPDSRSPVLFFAQEGRGINCEPERLRRSLGLNREKSEETNVDRKSCDPHMNLLAFQR